MQTLAQNYGFINYVVPKTRSTAASLSKSNMAFISLKGYSKVTFIITAGAMTEATTLVSAYQAKNVTGSSVSATALTLTTYWTNVASTGIMALTRTAATSNRVVVTSAANAVYMFEIDAKQLNATSNFDCVGLGISGISAATCFSVKAILHDARYAADAMPVNARAN